MVVINKQRLMMVFGCVLACISLPVLFGGVRFSRKSPNTIGTIVKNDTQALQVDAFEGTADRHTRLVVRNVSSKDVNGYVIGFGDGSRVTNDISSGDRVIAPGATDTIEFPAEKAFLNVSITAAMFADGTVEGEPSTVQHIRQWRSELKTQLSRGLLLLNEAVDSPDTQSTQSLYRTESALSSLPIRPDAPEIISHGGLRYGKDSLLNELRSVRLRREHNPNLDQRRSLIELRERIKRRIASI